MKLGLAAPAGNCAGPLVDEAGRRTSWERFTTCGRTFGSSRGGSRPRSAANPCDHLFKAHARARQRKETHMPKGKMLVYTDSISPERDAEFNAWYDSVHVPDVLKIDGIIGCTRFKVAESPAADTPGKYLAIYDVEADDFNDILDALVTAFTDGSLPTNDCLVPGPIIFLQPAT
jgi:hypothetical protein